MPIPRRPGRLAWLRYALGGRLPESMREWVRHDLTDAGWRGRALLRLVVTLLPVLVVAALLPGPGYIHLLLPLFVLLASGFISAAYGEELRDRRLRQHDLPPSQPGSSGT